MKNILKLYMVILGATPKGRLIEQHDVFFGIGHSLAELVPKMKAFWPEAHGKIHIDSWREVTAVDGYRIEIMTDEIPSGDLQLYFINLGGYKPGELEEYHYKILSVADSMAAAVKKSKTTSFYKHFGFRGAESHVDDKFGIDVDDIYKVAEIVNAPQYAFRFTKSEDPIEDTLHIGYLKIEKLQKAVSL